MPSILNRYDASITVAGCDEAGRGCLAGPVYGAAVILPTTFSHPLLNDSKQLNVSVREELREYIELYALAYGVGSVSPAEIDEINILQASFLAIHRALEQLNQSFDLILMDGNRFKPFKDIPHDCIIKGDGKYLSIAAASVLAKTHRDEYMCSLSDHHPAYCWHKNKGYPTREHRVAIQEFGDTTEHRKTFKLLPDNQLDLF